jgi:toxin-antitoxin system PIN domain toxin
VGEGERQGEEEVIAVETNVLVYAHQRWSREHPVAHAVMSALAASTQPWAIPWPCVYEFYRVVTDPLVWKARASTPQQAWAQLEDWLRSPSLQLIGETETTISILGPLLRGRVRGAKVHDARIAALCLAHGVDTLYSRDRDFTLFPELTVVDPFAGKPPSRAGERRARYALRVSRQGA